VSRKKALLALTSLVFLLPLISQSIDMNEVNALEEFRWGVAAFNRGQYNDSMRSLERALAYTPNNLTYQEWLGMALFRAGYEAQALDMWEYILARRTDPVLSSRVELQRFRQGLGRELAEEGRYVVAGVVEGAAGRLSVFRRPSAVFPMPDGGFYLAAYGSNQVSYFDINGALVYTLSGGLEGIANPYDILYSPQTGNLYISEFGAHRIIRCNSRGQINLRFGGRGRGPGQFLGPQYLAEDDKGYLYVCDYGNRRISKFDSQGQFILNFGGPGGSFAGLREPTGIAVLGETIYAADSRLGIIAAFDQSGNYLGSLGEGLLSAPEGLSLWEEGRLLVTDQNRVYVLNPSQESLSLLADLSGTNVRILKASRDINGNLLVPDFNNSRISFLTEVSRLYSGLAVQVLRIDSLSFPENQVDILVEDPQGNPVVGLSERNFLLSEIFEDNRLVDQFRLISRGNLSGALNLALVADRDPGMAPYAEDLRRAAGTLFDSLGGAGRITLITAGDPPVPASPPDSGRNSFAAAAAGRREDYRGGPLDLALRLAVSEVLGGRGFNGVVYLCHGPPGRDAFKTYTLLDTLRFFKNNGVSFHVIYAGPEGAVSEELEYLARETGGSSLSLYRPEGLNGFVQSITEKPNGTYTLAFTSRVEPDFGRRFIPLQVEVQLYNHTGRERSGYFAPSEY
jgi:DNA-binding beta-propeller fold protein YncE